MKGVAPAAGQRAANYEAMVLAFSRLSHAVVADQTPAGGLAAAAETGAVLLQADSGAAFLYDASSDGIELAAAHEIDIPRRGSSLPAEAVVRECIESGSPVIVPNISADRRKGLAQLARKGVASVLCVPLTVADRCLGALMVMTAALRAFSASDIELLGAVADQAALAAWKARFSRSAADPGASPITASDLELIDLVNGKIRELSTINKVSEAVMSTLDLSELLDLALGQCLSSVGAGVGSIMLLDEESEFLTIKVAMGLSKEVAESASVALGQGIAGCVAEKGQPVLVHDARSDSRFHMQSYRDDITSAMSIPLKARGRVIGVLNASTTEPHRRFGPKDVEFLSTIASQVAMAIDNARLYERLEHRSAELASLLQISETITSSLELKDVLAALAKRFTAMAQVDAGALLVFDADTQRFRCLNGLGLTRPGKKSAYLELAQPIAQKTLEANVPMWADLSPGSPLATSISEAEGFLSAVCVPLTASGRLVGAAAVFSREQRAFSGSELRTLAALGSLAGVAVHNSLIYQHKYDIARSLQFELTPRVPLAADGLEVGHRFLPAREVGGDYYDFIKIAPGKAGVVIADVAGSSVRAAMYTSMGRNVLRAYAVEGHPPSGVLARLNRIACLETQPEVFISVFYGVFDAAERSFRYACAGHEPPILFRPDGSFETLRADGLLVGIKPDADYEEKCIRLDSGAILVLFTDGVVDSPAVRGRFGVEQIRRIVASGPLKPAQELADNIVEGLVETAGSRMQDDVALVVLKVL